MAISKYGRKIAAPHKDKGRQINIRISDDLYYIMRSLCDEAGVTMTVFLGHAINNELDKWTHEE